MKENTYYHLDPEVKARWLEALRSGRYEQGKGRLYRNGAYCCLGVLCDVMGLERGAAPDKLLKLVTFHYKGTSSADVLPRALADELGITGGGSLNTPVLNPRNPREALGTLWELNDSADLTFAQIADIIEEQF